MEINIIQLENASIQTPKDLVNWVGSLKNSAEAIQGPCLIVTDAWGRSRQALEILVNTFFEDTALAFEHLEKIRAYYLSFVQELFPDDYPKKDEILDDISNSLVEIEWLLEEGPLDAYDYIFDQMVSIGPVLASKVLGYYLELLKIPVQQWDARDYMLTDNLHGMANLDQTQSALAVQKIIERSIPNVWIVTQNGIGSTSENFTTTFGPKGRNLTLKTIGQALGLEYYWKDQSVDQEPSVFSKNGF